jgi:hypothetical protein
MTASDAWQVSIATRVEASQALVMFDSYLTRAAGTACHALEAQMASLRSAETRFDVSCNDSSSRFRLNTTLVYSEQLDVVAWLQQHRTSRLQAWTLLESAHAVQR